VNVITKPTIHKCLSLALQSSEHLDENEIVQITQFCFDAISSPPAGSRNIVNDIMDLIPHSQPKNSIYPDYIHEDAYHECCLMNDVLGFDEVAQLFDKDRRRHLCENFFMPRDFRGCLERARKVKPNTQEFSSIVATAFGSASIPSLAHLADPVVRKLDSENLPTWAEELLTWQTECKSKLESLTAAMGSMSQAVSSVQQKNQTLESLLTAHIDSLQDLKKRSDGVEELNNAQDKCSQVLGGRCAQLESTVQSLQQHWSAAEVGDLWKSHESLQQRVAMQEEQLQQLTELLPSWRSEPVATTLNLVETHPENLDDSDTRQRLFGACALSSRESGSIGEHKRAETPPGVALKRGGSRGRACSSVGKRFCF